MEATIAEDFEAFRLEVSSCDSCIAVLDPRGLCVWNSAEAFGSRLTAVEGVIALEQALKSVVSASDGGDVAMGDA